MAESKNPIAGKGFLKLAQAGIANASNSLAMLAPDKLCMDVLWAGSVPTPRLSEVSGNPEDMVVGAYVWVRGDAPGHALLLFSLPSAMMLSDLVMGSPIGTTQELGEMEQSVVKELANILTSSYLTAIADHYRITLLPDPPLLAMDMAAAIIDNVLLNSGTFDRETLSIVTRFRSDQDTMDGVFLYIPGTNSPMEGR